MRHLGDFGTARDPADFTFGYFGEELRVNPDLSDVAVFDLFGQDDGSSAALAEKLRAIGATVIHPDDLDRFWQVFRQNRQTMDDLATLTKGLLAAVMDRPTELPSDSSGGQPTTVTSSEDDYSRAMASQRGRPDLQLMVMQAEEARRSA